MHARAAKRGMCQRGEGCPAVTKRQPKTADAMHEHVRFLGTVMTYREMFDQLRAEHAALVVECALVTGRGGRLQRPTYGVGAADPENGVTYEIPASVARTIARELGIEITVRGSVAAWRRQCKDDAGPKGGVSYGLG